MTGRRRTYRADIADKVSGLLARYDTTCPVCDGPIVSHASRVVVRKQQYVHVSCVSGADDE